MGYSEPYSTLLAEIAARLISGVGDAGPFASAGQVQVWAAVALDELAPSAELERALSGGAARALVCDGGSRPEEEHSDGYTETQTVKVWLCASAPTMAAAVTGDGDEYWGAGALKHWSQTRLTDRAWSPTGWETLRWVGTEAVATRLNGAALVVATFETRRVQET